MPQLDISPPITGAAAVALEKKRGEKERREGRGHARAPFYFIVCALQRGGRGVWCGESRQAIMG